MPRLPSCSGGDDGLAALGGKQRDQSIQVARRNARHVAQQHQRPVGLARQRPHAGLERGAEPLGEVRVGHECHIEAGKRRPHSLRLMPRHHQHRACLARQRSLRHPPHDGRPAKLGQQLVRRAHAGRAPGGEHDCGDFVLSGHEARTINPVCLPSEAPPGEDNMCCLVDGQRC